MAHWTFIHGYFMNYVGDEPSTCVIANFSSWELEKHATFPLLSLVVVGVASIRFYFSRLTFFRYSMSYQ